MPEDKRSASVRENGKSDYAVTIEVSGHIIDGDEPEGRGGKNTGPSPYDLLLAALGECTAMTVRWYARRQDWPLEKVEVTLTHEKVRPEDLPEGKGRTHKVDVFEKKVVVHGDKLTGQQRATLVDIAAKCPVQRTLESDVIIRTLK